MSVTSIPSQTRSQLRGLSPTGARPAESAPVLDGFERSAERPTSESGPGWGVLSLATLGVLAAGTGVVHAQMQAAQPQVPVKINLLTEDKSASAQEDPLVVAHRGDTKNATENTLEAFRNALAEGANALELDVHLTADGDLAVIHDDTLDRTYGRPGVVREMTSAELRAAGVPMLSDVLALPDCKLIVEIKHPKGGRHVGIEQILIDQLERAGADDRTVVISFDETSLKKLHELDPELDTGYLYSGKNLDPAQTREELGVEYLGPHYSQVTEDYVRKAHEAGLKVNPWTVNDPAALQRMIELDCDAITTDVPADLVEMLIAGQH